MTTRADLRPVEKPLVMNLLAQIGVDVSKWKEMKGGATKAASNPKYCYNWSFQQPGEMVVACLWFEGLQQKGKQIFYELNPKSRGSIRTEPGSGSWNKRANDLDAHLWLAYSQQLPLRVIIVNGEQRNPAHAKPKASVVEARLLDEAPWAVTEYDLSTGKCTMVRGEKPVPITISASDHELSGFEGKRRPKFILHRRREAELRRAKIVEALTKTGKLVCEVPNCEFDFAVRYGSLGQGYAQVHHLIPLSKAPPEGRKIFLKDLAIVCANCHVMVHAGGECRPLAGLISS